MLKWTSNTPISLRLFFTFAWATIIPFIVIITLSSLYFQALDTGRQAVQVSNQTIKITTDELAHLQSMHALLVALLPSVTINSNANASVARSEQDVIFQVLSIEGSFDVDTVKYQAQYQLATAPAMADIRQILLSNDPHTSIISSQQTLLDKILEHQWPQYKAAQDDVLIGLDTRLPLAKAANLLQKADALYAPLLANWQQVVDIAEGVNTEVVKVGPAQSNPILIGTIIAFISSMIIVFSIGYLVNLTITRPLRQLISLTRRVGGGDTMARARLNGKDEIAKVALSMNTMLDTIVQLAESARRQHDMLQARVGKLASEAKGVGEGNLRIRADATGDMLGTLASSFNSMVSELESLVVRIKRVARNVEFLTMLTREQMTRLVQVGDFQIRQVIEATSGVEQMAQASQEVAQRAQTLQNIANDAQQGAVGGRQATLEAINELGQIHSNVQATASRVRTLGERSQEINDIVEVIFSLAYQTHRLALDSAIQAAIAGEDRKEFGAVAISIRRLAEQAKSEANGIARIVRSVQEDITEAAASMEKTQRETLLESKATQDVEQALENIFATVERQARDITDITGMVTQQLELATAVAQIMQYVTYTTQQNKARVSDAAKYMQRLAQLVEQLRISVGALTVYEEQPPQIAPSLSARQARAKNGLLPIRSSRPFPAGNKSNSGPLPYTQQPPASNTDPGAAQAPLPLLPYGPPRQPRKPERRK
jgi:methyl-accepting chemotaxis protein